MFASTPYFLSVDWGASSLRIRLVQTCDCSVLDELLAPCGVGKIAAEITLAGAEREHHFARLLEGHLQSLARQTGRSLQGMPAMISDTASSTLGWRNLPHAAAPFAVDGTGLRGEILGDIAPSYSSPASKRPAT